MKTGGKGIPDWHKHEQRHRGDTQHSEHGKRQTAWPHKQDGEGVVKEAGDFGRGHTTVILHDCAILQGCSNPLMTPRWGWCICSPSSLLLWSWHILFSKLAPQGEQAGPAGIGCLERDWWNVQLCHVMPEAEISPSCSLWAKTLPEEAGVWPIPPTSGPWVIYPADLQWRNSEHYVRCLENTEEQLDSPSSGMYYINTQGNVTRLKTCEISSWFLLK